MFPAALFGALLFVALPVRVESEDCPSGVEVEQILASILPTVSNAVRPDLAHITRHDGKLRIELVDAEATVIAERVLDDAGSCSELAKLAAVVIGSWESDVHPEFVLSHAEPLPVPVVAPRAVQASGPHAYDVALGASLSLAGSLAVGSTLAMLWVPRGSGPGLRLFAAGETTRTLDLGSGQARWRRWVGSVDLDWRFAHGPLVLDVHGGLGLGWLAVSGVGFSENRSSSLFSLAASVGARLSWWVTRRFATWLELGGLYWTRSQMVYGEPAVREQEIPRLQGLVSIGLALGRVEADP
jgi:hypothetical protein